VVSSSGGNAGLATAYAAEQLGLACTVVLPMSTPKFVADRLRQYNAEVLVHGLVWDAANEKAMEIVEEVGGALIHPFEVASSRPPHPHYYRHFFVVQNSSSPCRA